MVLLLTEEDVQQLLPMREAMEAVEEAFRRLGLGEAYNQPRRRLSTPKGGLSIMSAGVPVMNGLGFKVYTSFRKKSRFYVFLFDCEDGAPLLVAHADRLGQIRTGAASGVATKYMARKDCPVVGVFGSGRQAKTQLEAVCAVRSVEEIRVYGRNRDRLASFCGEMAEALGVRIISAVSPRSIVEGSDIVITVTDSREPVFDGGWLSEGAHLNLVGSNWPGKREVDDETIRRCGSIVVDSREAAMLEAGDLLIPAEKGLLDWNHVVELGAVVVGRAAGRTSDQEVTCFKSVGLALEDVAVASRLYESAVAKGFGRHIDFG